MSHPTPRKLARFLGDIELPDNRMLAHWVRLFENFQYSSREFYALVEGNIGERQMDRTRLSFATLKERGLFSATRLYLCVQRERLLYVICAAPFGTGYLVTSRLIDRRRTARLLDYLLALGLLASGYYFLWRQFGWVWAVVLIGFSFSFFWSLMRVAGATAWEWLQDELAEVPVLGPIYERWFNPDTFYRRDQTAGFLRAVHNAVIQSVESMVLARGLRPLTEEEKRPVLSDL